MRLKDWPVRLLVAALCSVKQGHSKTFTDEFKLHLEPVSVAPKETKKEKLKKPPKPPSSIGIGDLQKVFREAIEAENLSTEDKKRYNDLAKEHAEAKANNNKEEQNRKLKELRALYKAKLYSRK
eukprot:gnl/MRDRNA2_/MRDRNA2_97673_c0_seq1.p1 gnl/MRDRNA2_/MRDRNA2_97673_c0~~gnl/MRDRNA2_/MRDRNA2_97673_c0_seq1.p1  ORF type:complete len:124 (-),score=36.43 gnl/MRDRNA2_/MRDRNA2_97673_c0_seq1:18-389(-)